MDSPFETENENLRSSWDQFSREHLDRYLVSDVEDPRINVQSILTRALIADTLWPDEFTDLIDAELRFGAVLTWLLLELKKGIDRHQLLNLVNPDDENTCPAFVRETSRWLREDRFPVVDYITCALADVGAGEPEPRLGDEALDTYSGIWRQKLQEYSGGELRILEPACGSANDFRFIDKCGLSEFIRYTGIDISEKNIANARARFPRMDFRVASMIDSGLPDDSFDYLFVHDLLEHLSLEAMEHVLAEILRVVVHQAWVHCFNVEMCDEHVARPVEKYHWNTLSLDGLLKTIHGLGGEVEVVPISEFLKNKFGDCDYHNLGAFTLLVSKKR